MRTDRRVFIKTAALSAVLLGSGTGAAFASTADVIRLRHRR